MTMSSQYGSALFWWAEANPHPSCTMMMEKLTKLIDGKEEVDMRELRNILQSYEDPRFEYFPDLESWGHHRFLKSLKPEYHLAFNEWNKEQGHRYGVFTHDESIYLSMSGYSRAGAFVTIDPISHPPP